VTAAGRTRSAADWAESAAVHRPGCRAEVDPLPSFGPPREQRLFPRSNGHSLARVDCHRTAFPAVRWPTV